MVSELLARIKQDITLARKAREKKKVELLDLMLGLIADEAGGCYVTDEIVVRVVKHAIRVNQETVDMVQGRRPANLIKTFDVAILMAYKVLKDKLTDPLIEDNDFLENYLPKAIGDWNERIASKN